MSGRWLYAFLMGYAVVVARLQAVADGSLRTQEANDRSEPLLLPAPTECEDSTEEVIEICFRPPDECPICGFPGRLRPEDGAIWCFVCDDVRYPD